MVLLAAAICNKSGKTIISRQFVELTRSRVEGLLAAFPKLMGSGKQHTFVETDSVRYVYQPLEKLYMLLITTKASNILEDLETLRLFARVIPEYCRNVDEAEIIDQAFPLIFAFDEIVALGYRENVNLAQIRTFTEMDSHEERVFNAVRQTQEKEAKENMKRKAKELQQQRRDMAKQGGGKQYYSGGMGGGSMGRGDYPVTDNSTAEPVKSTYTAASKPSRGGTGMKIGTKKKDVDSFVDQLQSEGECVTTTTTTTRGPSTISKVTKPPTNQLPVHVKILEKMSVSLGRDGGLHNLEVHGLMQLSIGEDKFGYIKLLVSNNDTKGAQLQTNPNINKALFTSSSCLGLKNPDKPFPLHQEIGVLKWRLQTQDESLLPLSLNCWPSASGSGCDVNIEYELEMTEMELHDILISIPVPSGVGPPVVSECNSEYHYDSRRGTLDWSVPVIDADNKSGSMEFSMPARPADFFPIQVSFTSPRTFCDIELSEVRLVTDDSPVKYSTETYLHVDKYEVV